MPQLQSDDKRIVSAALKSISIFDPDLSTELSGIFASQGGTEALTDLMESPNRKLADKAKETLDSLFGALKDAVIRITDAEGILMGSGFMLNKNGLVLTAAHVIESSHQEIDHILVDYQGWLYIASIIDFHEDSRMLLLKVDGSDFNYLTISENKPSLFEEIFIRRPHVSLGWTVGNGKVIGVDAEMPEEVNHLFITSDIQSGPGSSGSPVVNRSSQVIGMVYAITSPNKWDQSTTILISNTDILKFLNNYYNGSPTTKEEIVEAEFDSL